MNSKREPKEGWSEKAEQFELQPSANLWGNIEKGLDQHKRKRRVILWLFITGSLLIGLGIMYYQENCGNELKTNYETVNTDKTKASKQPIININKRNNVVENNLDSKTGNIQQNKNEKIKLSINPIIHTASPIEPKTDMAASTAIVTTKVNTTSAISVITTTTTNTTKTDTVAISNLSPSLANKQQMETTQTTPASISTTQTTTPTTNKTKTDSVALSNLSPSITNQQRMETTPTTNKTKTDSVTLSNLSPSIANQRHMETTQTISNHFKQPQTTSNDLKQPQTTPPSTTPDSSSNAVGPGKLSLQIGIMPLISTNHITEHTDLSSLDNYRNSRTKSQLTVAVDFRINLRLNKKWSVGSGLSFITIGEQLKNEQLVYRVDTLFPISTSFPSNFQLQTNLATVLLDSTNDKDKYVNTQYQYLQIPLALSYNIISLKKIGIGIGAEFIYMKLIDADFYEYDFSTNRYVNRKKNDHGSLRNSNIAISGSITFNYKVGRHFGLYLAPAFQNYFNSLYDKKSVVDQKHYNVGLKAGLNYFFY